MDRQTPAVGSPRQRAANTTRAARRAADVSRRTRRLRLLLAAAVALMTAGVCASSASATVALCDVPITMSDGVVLRANIWLPSSSGHYPTVLTVTGYNKDAESPTGECADSAGQGIAGDEPALAEKGFAVMVVDDRGTGDSGGKWESWGERTQQDYKELLGWIQRGGLPQQAKPRIID